MDIQQIVILAKQRDVQAERALFNALAPRLMTMCKRYSYDDHQAKDYLQDCFIKVFDQLDKYDSTKGHFESWFFRVSTNLILQDKRRRKTMQLTELTEQHDTADSILNMDTISDDQLMMAIRRLPDGYRDILNLYVFEKWSHKDIAVMMNITEGTSRSQYARAKKLLKKLLIELVPNVYEKRLA